MKPSQPYSGMTVVDLTHELGSYAARLFADLGADVIRLEPRGGGPDRMRIAEAPNGEARRAATAAFAFRNASKTALELDMGDAKGREQAATYIRTARVVFLERDGLLADRIEWIRQLNPAAIVTYVSPYGLNGPRAHWKSDDLTLQAAGGIAWLSGRPGEPPLRLPAEQSAMITSVYAGVATAAALMDADENGQGHLIDVSGQECIAHSLQNAIQVYDLEGIISTRGGEGTRDAAEDIFECRDGRMLVASPLGLGPSWHSLVAWIKDTGHAASKVLSQPRWLDGRWRKTQEARQEFRDAFGSFIAGYTRSEIIEQALERKIVMSPVSRIADILGDQQLAHRSYFVRLTGCGTEGEIAFPGAPYQFSDPIWSVSPPPTTTAT